MTIKLTVEHQSLIYSDIIIKKKRLKQFYWIHFSILYYIRKQRTIGITFVNTYILYCSTKSHKGCEI